jgi:hypothetical protein
VERGQLPHYAGSRKMEGPVTPVNNCVQATPGCALLFIVAQVSGAPDAERSRNEP